MYDPSTAPGGELTTRDICNLVSERLHLLPVFKWRLAEIPFSLDLPYWIEDPDFDLDFHIRDSAVPPPGNNDRLSETVARIFAPARSPPAAVGAVPDPRPRGRPGGSADQDPSFGS